VRSGLLAGLAFWCRPDAAVGAGWLGLLLWRDRRRFPWAYVLTAAVVALAGCLAAWSWFGTIVPNTLEAKRQFAALDPSARTGARIFWGNALSLFRYFAGPLSWIVPLLGLVGQWPLFRASGRAGRLLVLHAGSLALAYTVLEVPFFIWYTLPAAVACLYGAAYAGGWAVRRLLALRSASRRLPALAAATVLALAVVSWGIGSVLWWREGNAWDWQLAAYSRAGAWLREHTGPQADVAAEEVGILAFTSGRPVLDLIGLVSPRSMPYAAQGDMAGAFLAGPTRFVVFHTFTPRGGTRPIVSKAWFPRAYRRVARFDFPQLGGSLFLYRRRSGAQIPPPRPPRPHKTLEEQAGGL
jgi:hypothetical protein